MHVGSSPLARGTLEHRPHIKAAPGLIPARAGNTSFPNDGAGIPWAHPRSRGEHVQSAGRRVPSPGSSPLARGTREGLVGGCSGVGLIPARAGNTRWSQFQGSRLRAHPRSRGEHTVDPATLKEWGGSSPLARGPQCAYHSMDARDGLIPARAGTTDRKCCDALILGAHPRSRGDHKNTLPQTIKGQGSSPLARGPHAGAGFIEHTRGLIPARAGTTAALPFCVPQTWAHPRSRGDHTIDAISSAFRWGSSPLARGPHLLTWGFTPYISKIESL